MKGYTMDYKKLTSPCGIDCFNCELYKDNITGELQKKIAAYKKVSLGSVTCDGCRESGCYLLDGKCATKQCIEEKGVEFCHECDQFPCIHLHPCLDKAQDYPHNYKLYNLCRIKKIGLKQWAENEAADIRKRYRHGELIIGHGPEL